MLVPSPPEVPMTIPTSPAAAPPAAPARPFSSITEDQLTVGGLIRTTLTVWWRNGLRFAGLSLLLLVPIFVVGVVAGIAIPIAIRRGALPPGARWPFFVFGAVLVVGVLLFTVIQTGALTYGTVQHLSERPVRFGAMLAAGFRRAMPLVATGVLAYLAILVGLVLLVIPGIIVACALSAALPSVVVERIGPIQALQRSWALTRDHRFTIFAAWLVLGLVLFGANVILQVGTKLLGPIAGLILLPVQLFIASIPVLLPAVAYYELRVEKEGTDTSELAKVFE
jgi:membrane-anchored glycerophosphoryl diester phosphodiesterase (GDPDase)